MNGVARDVMRRQITENQEQLQRIAATVRNEPDPQKRLEIEAMLRPMMEQLDRMMDLMVVRQMDAASGKSPKAAIRREFICALGAQFKAWNPDAKLDPTIISMVQTRLLYLAAFRPAEFTYTDRTIGQYLKGLTRKSR